MCDFASFVLTKDKVFWSDSNSHTDIIEEFGLHEDGANGPNILSRNFSHHQNKISPGL